MATKLTERTLTLHSITCAKCRKVLLKQADLLKEPASKKLSWPLKKNSKRKYRTLALLQRLIKWSLVTPTRRMKRWRQTFRSTRGLKHTTKKLRRISKISKYSTTVSTILDQSAGSLRPTLLSILKLEIDTLTYHGQDQRCPKVKRSGTAAYSWRARRSIWDKALTLCRARRSLTPFTLWMAGEKDMTDNRKTFASEKETKTRTTGKVLTGR